MSATALSTPVPTTYRSRLTSPVFPAGNLGDWQTRHRAALRHPRGAEAPILGMLTSWLQYADQHREAYESGIGDDYYLGPQWASIGRSLLSVLNGDTGRLDCGTLNALIRDVLVTEGFTHE